MISTVTVEIDGKKLFIPAAKVDGVIWFHYNGQTYSMEPEAPIQSSKRAVRKILDGDVKAPMPGKILKVFVQKDDIVAEGQPVLAMEAMKMEYTLQSPSAGKVTSVACHVGAQVQIHQTLVSIRAESQ